MTHNQRTFTRDDMSVTLVVERSDGKPPEEGGSYKVRYLVNGKDEYETELMEGFREDDCLDVLETLAEDYFDSEKERLENLYKTRL